MSQWGVFRITDSDVLHIAPCDKDGFSLSPHIMAEYCLCKPKLQEGLWVHQDDGEPASGSTKETACEPDCTAPTEGDCIRDGRSCKESKHG